MRIWRLSDPSDHRFARASRRGSWSLDLGVCPECGTSSQQRVKPLILEWEPDSDVIGDFTWPGFDDDIAITGRVVEALKHCGGFEPGPVEMIQNPRLKRPRSTRRSKPRVWLPYQGPTLYDLWVTQKVHLDLERSSVWLTKDCRTCDRKRYAAEGIERREIGWDQERLEPVITHSPRSRGLGLFVAQNALAGGSIFRTYETPAWILCTDAVKEIVERSGFSNVQFLEVGETF